MPNFAREEENRKRRRDFALAGPQIRGFKKAQDEADSMVRKHFDLPPYKAKWFAELTDRLNAGEAITADDVTYVQAHAGLSKRRKVNAAVHAIAARFGLDYQRLFNEAPQGESQAWNHARALTKLKASSPKATKKQGGQSRYSDADVKRVTDAWATGGHSTYYDLAQALGVGWTGNKVEKIIDTARRRAPKN